jgi:hypothetical protein
MSASRTIISRMFIALVVLFILSTMTACEADWNPFTPTRYNCVSWRSLHPVDTTRSSTLVVSHPDSVCAIRK